MNTEPQVPNLEQYNYYDDLNNYVDPNLFNFDQDVQVLDFFKKGGSLKRIPFMQEGTPKNGITTKNGVKIILPEYMQKTQIGYPSILPGRYTGLERVTPSLFNMFKTWIKGLPKSLSTSDKITIGAGAVAGNVLGYDDTHNQHIRKTLNKVGKYIEPVIEQSMEWKPFSAEGIIKPFSEPKKFKK